MRIIAGKLKGRQFNSPHGHRTHPMSDKMRGALFNTLGDIAGLTLLDAFAGSGAISFEAVSRGAATATAIDRDPSAQKAIADNIKILGVNRAVKLIKAPAASWLTTTKDSFDIVVVDPPWDEPQPGLIARLSERTRQGGIFVTSLPKGLAIKLDERFELLQQKDYGDGSLSFYRAL